VQGYGKITYKNGRSYNGMWEDGKYQGFAEARFPNNNFFLGFFKDNMPHGHQLYFH